MSVSDERLRDITAHYGPLCRKRGPNSRNKPSVRRDTYEALRELARRRELSGPMAPIARVTVENCGVYETIHEVVRTTLYAPGLPEGDHDLYPEPPQHDDLRRDLEEARDELASLREQVRWRPMEEAPKDGTHVLAFFPDWQCTGEPRVMAVKWTGPPDSKHNWWSIPGYGGLSPDCWRPIGPLPGGDA